MVVEKITAVGLWYSQPHRGYGCRTSMRLTAVAVAVIRSITTTNTDDRAKIHGFDVDGLTNCVLQYSRAKTHIFGVYVCQY